MDKSQRMDGFQRLEKVMSRSKDILSRSRGMMPENNNNVADDLRAKGEEILQKLKESIRRIRALLPEDYRAAPMGTREKLNNNKPREGLGNKMETLNIYHCNVRSIGNKKKSVDEIIRANNIDICFLSELNNKCVPLFKGYHQFTRYDKRRFHGMTAIVANHLKGSVIRIPDESELEIVHLVIKDSNPVLNVIGVYLDVESRLNVEKVQSVWAQLTAKVDNILERGEAVNLIGDFNRPDTTKPTMGRKLLVDWLTEEGGTVTLVNDPKVPTRIDPGTKKGSVLDLCIVSENIRKCVKKFQVDTNRKMTPFGMIKTKGVVTKKDTDHLAVMVTLKIPIQYSLRHLNSLL